MSLCPNCEKVKKQGAIICDPCRRKPHIAKLYGVYPIDRYGRAILPDRAYEEKIKNWRRSVEE